MSSDIPRARNILKWALDDKLDLVATRDAIRRALRLMTRKQAEFRAPDNVVPMTTATKQRARALRHKGWPIRRIAEKLHTNSGRVSEACSDGR
jgi:hypothetical protein